MNIKDRLPFVPAMEAVRGAFLALDRIQTERPETIVTGVSMLFTQMCAALNLDPTQLINASQRRAADQDTFFQRELKALDAYFKGEVA